MKISVFVGTRPEIIKMQPVIKKVQNSKHDLTFVHTGQHYDFMMSSVFINELELPKPDYFLNVKSTSQGIQTARIIARSESILKNKMPNIVLVQGDTNSALGVAIASSKLGIAVGHVEAGCRSFDKSMSEEINRLLISDIATFHFAPTQNCVENLRREGITSQVFLTGHPIVDLLKEINTKKNIYNNLAKFGHSHKGYALVTVHRRENIDNKDKISEILVALDQISQKVPVIFPCHPHTRLQMKKFGLTNYLKNLKVVQPVRYLESLSLIKGSRFVLTDSGGIQQEASLLRTPCITLRDRTEWIETVEAGVNFIVGHRSKRIITAVENMQRNYNLIMRKFSSTQNLFGMIGVSRRIIQEIEKN